MSPPIWTEQDVKEWCEWRGGVTQSLDDLGSGQDDLRKELRGLRATVWKISLIVAGISATIGGGVATVVAAIGG